MDKQRPQSVIWYLVTALLALQLVFRLLPTNLAYSDFKHLIATGKLHEAAGDEGVEANLRHHALAACGGAPARALDRCYARARASNFFSSPSGRALSTSSRRSQPLRA